MKRNQMIVGLFVVLVLAIIVAICTAPVVGSDFDPFYTPTGETGYGCNRIDRIPCGTPRPTKTVEPTLINP
jgi:hypothetical protein